VPLHAKEAALKEDLFTFRQCIREFHTDKTRYPSSLAELVSQRYIRKIPIDPFTRSDTTWQVRREPPSASGQGIVDVHSGSNAVASNGTTYNTW